MEQKIDKEVFDTFFRENYIPIEYETIRPDFEEIASVGYDLFSEELGDKELTEKNFILYMRGYYYALFEDCLAENFEAVNSEIVDAVMDVSAGTEHCDEITSVYWDTLDTLLKSFLKQLYQEHFAGKRA